MILLAVAPRFFVFAQGCGHVGVARQRGGQLDAVEDCLRSAVGAHRIHQVGGVAEQGDASPAPVRQRIAVYHRVLQDQLVAGQQVADVEPARSQSAKNGSTSSRRPSRFQSASLSSWPTAALGTMHTQFTSDLPSAA